ncbi:MAG: PHP domain-containing protein [Bacteroidales bacterium]
MRIFKADLHVHSVLSPCGDLEMSPARIVEEAARKKIDILGIADHNSTLHGPLIKRLAAEKGIFVLCGAEVTTKEETHCLAFFEDLEKLGIFQQYLEDHLPDIANNPRYFGYQVVVDENGLILEQIDKLLISALDQTIEQLEEKVHGLGGLFIPAHIDRPSYSLISQLGFVPPGLRADAFEVSRLTTPADMVKKFPYLEGRSFIGGSDAHQPEQIGSRKTLMLIQEAGFEEIRLALKGEGGRTVMIEPGHGRSNEVSRN